MLAAALVGLIAGAPTVAAPALLMPPRVYGVAPQRPYLDLGPVLAVEQRGASIDEELAFQAARLKADGFIREGRGMREVYLMAGTTWAKKNPGLASTARVVLMTTALLLSGTVPFGSFQERPVGQQQLAFYRAIRFVDAIPPPVDLSTARLDVSVRAQLDGATSLADQLDIVHALLVTGGLTVDRYALLRSCLAGTAPCG